MKLAETPDELGKGIRNEALCVERALAQERHRDSDLEPRPTDAGGVGHTRDEGSVCIACWHAEHQSRPYLGGKAEVDESDLTPPRGSQA